MVVLPIRCHPLPVTRSQAIIATAMVAPRLAQQERRKLVLGKVGRPAGACALLLPIVVIQPGVRHVAEGTVVHVRELRPQNLHDVYVEVVLLRMHKEVG